MRISLKSCSGCCCLQLLVPSTCWTLCPQVILLWAKPAGLTPNPGHANPAGLSGRAQKPRRGSFLLVVLSGSSLFTLRAAAKSWKAEKAPNPHGCGCLQRQQLPALQQGDAHPAKPSPSRCLSLRSELSHICAALGLHFQSELTYISAIPSELVCLDPHTGLQLKRSTQQK